MPIHLINFVGWLCKKMCDIQVNEFCKELRQWVHLANAYLFNHCYNIASKFVQSNSIAWVCFIFLLCMDMTSANKSLKKKIFHRGENVVKQLVHTSAVHLSRYEALGKFGEHLQQLLHIFHALQTSCVLHISMNACWLMNQLVNIFDTSDMSVFIWGSWSLAEISQWGDTKLIFIIPAVRVKME